VATPKNKLSLPPRRWRDQIVNKPAAIPASAPANNQPGENASTNLPPIRQTAMMFHTMPSAMDTGMMMRIAA
jgi:hypothetical protein